MKLKAKEYFLISAIIIIVAAVSIFFGSRKADYYVDEVWTYGLANNIGSTEPDIEYEKEYTGMGPFETFLEVRDGEGFNYVNVWQNQANDVHPPLYYIFIHTICSIFPNTFSKWYGIAVNLFWMIGITILLYKLAKQITGNIVASAGIAIAYETSLIFINTVIFIRMYAQVTFFVIAFAYLLKLYWDKQLDRKFYIWFALLAILGMLTHYYFLIIAFFMCLFFAIHLIVEKKFKELRSFVLDALISGILYLLSWYHFAGHLFRGYRGKEAISAAMTLDGLFDGTLAMISTINKEAFAGFLVFFAILLCVFAVISVKKKEISLNYELSLFLSAVLYVIVVGKIAPFRNERYIMPVIFAIIISAYTVLRYFVGMICKTKLAEYIVLLIFLFLNVFNIVSNGFYVNMDYYSEDKNKLMTDLESKKCIVYVDEEWESFYFYKALQNAGSYVFVNSENFSQVMEQQDENCVLAIRPNKVSKVINEDDFEELYRSNQEAYYRVKK